VWQEVRNELHPLGLEVVTVALDTGGADAAGRWIDRAKPEHPALIDQTHELARRLGILNVPSGVWVDEEGVIVRPPETAFPGKVSLPDDLPAEPSPQLIEVAQEVVKIRVSPKRYLAALHDWAVHGAESRFVLAPDEVVRRSKPLPPEVSLAAAHFELAQHLHRSGQVEAAIAHFAQARRLEPGNWTYKRQAWSFADQLQVDTGPYEGDWLSDIRELGPESYYAPLDMPRDPAA
jgi:hypothetical protein